MGRKRKYATVGEKQRAWRIRSGKQKEKVPLSIRRGESLGTPEGSIRAKKEDETWEEYHKYLVVASNRGGFGDYKVKKGIGEDEGNSVGAKRTFWGGKEPEFSEDYYEIRAQYEKSLEDLDKKGKLKKKK